MHDHHPRQRIRAGPQEGPTLTPRRDKHLCGDTLRVLRLTGCNLRCTWCDTAYAFYGGTKMSVGEVLARVRELSMPQGTQPEQTAGASTSQGTPQTHCAPARPAIPLVELTGGEPLLQPDVYPLPINFSLRVTQC